MYDFYIRNKEKLDKIIFTFIFLICSYLFFTYVFKYIAPFFVAVLFSYFAEPLVNFINKKLKINRGLSALLCITLSMVVFYFIGVGLVSKLIKELQAFSLSVPIYLDELTATIEQIKIEFQHYSNFIPGEVQVYFNDINPQIADFITNNLGNTVKNKSFYMVSKIPNILMNILIFIIASFFFIKDKRLIRDSIIKYSPHIFINQFRLLKRGLFGALGGYIKAQGIIMSFVAIINILGLVISGYPYALLMGLLIALVDALPVFGSGVVLWPWAILSIISQNYKMAIHLFILYLINLLTRQFLEPKVLSSQIGLHPIITLMSIYAGLKLFGGWGFFIGPVIAVSIKVLMTSYENS